MLILWFVFGVNKRWRRWSIYCWMISSFIYPKVIWIKLRKKCLTGNNMISWNLHTFLREGVSYSVINFFKRQKNKFFHLVGVLSHLFTTTLSLPLNFFQRKIYENTKKKTEEQTIVSYVALLQLHLIYTTDTRFYWRKEKVNSVENWKVLYYYCQR